MMVDALAVSLDMPLKWVSISHALTVVARVATPDEIRCCKSKFGGTRGMMGRHESDLDNFEFLEIGKFKT